jgi:MYXO-CTERM domain-containing protein
MHRSTRLPLLACAVLALTVSPTSAQPSFVAFETGPVRPLAIHGAILAAVNTPDNRLETFNVLETGITRRFSIPVGMEPCAVAIRAGGAEAWVVNHLSDSVSVVDLAAGRVTRTLLVGDEPRDIVITDPDASGPLGERVFITTAHRGQHRTHPSISSVSGAGDPELTTPSVPRADVWVFDADNPGAGVGGMPLEIVELFGDTPRALAVSADGSSVYAAIFHSGNQTAVVNEGRVCDGFGGSQCNGDGITSPNGLNNGRLPGGNPGPSTNFAGDPAPEVGLIVQFDEGSGQWRDENARNWSNGIRFHLPDLDVFEIDAATLNQTSSFAHVGTINFNMAVNPNNGNVYVSNTDAQNLTRFEGPGAFGGSTVQGNLHQARITVLEGSNVSPVHLNSHINYGISPAPPGTKDHSLATPLDMVISSDGSTLYVAAFGSSKVGVIPTSTLDNGTFDPTVESANYLAVSGGGPGGLALDEVNGILYVLTRFDNSISVVDLGTGTELNHFPLYNPEPDSILAGRAMLYDAFNTSSNGEASCSSCHVFADFDSLAWDLGNPDEVVTLNPIPINFEDVLQLFPIDTSGLNGSGDPRDFHPMKGPMTTQTLRGLSTSGPMHWRGDRSNGFFGINGTDEFNSFMNFIVAFPGLVGGATSPTDPGLQTAMADFTNFALQVMLPPNPIRALDNSLTSAQQAGMDFFDGSTGQLSDGANLNGFTCEGCHRHDPSQGFFGTGREASFEAEPQIIKIPHFRNLYQKVGMFGMPNVDFNLPGDGSHTGDQIRGTGFIHDGSTDTLFRFFTADVFRNPGILFNETNVGFNGGNPQRRDVEQALLAFDSDLAPVVGQQVTLDDTNLADVTDRIDLLEERAGATFVSATLGGVTTECDLVAHGIWNNRGRSALYDPVTDTYISDSLLDSPISAAEMRTMAQVPGQATTFTCVPPGSGARLALDRDGDGFRNYDEAVSNTDPANPGSISGACGDGIDNDGDGAIDLADTGCATVSGNIENPQCSDGYDNDGDGTIDFGGDSGCREPSWNNEVPLPSPTRDCSVSRSDPRSGVLWLAMMILVLRTRRRRRVGADQA